jgi:hypothetical protein
MQNMRKQSRKKYLREDCRILQSRFCWFRGCWQVYEVIGIPSAPFGFVDYNQISPSFDSWFGAARWYLRNTELP